MIREPIFIFEDVIKEICYRAKGDYKKPYKKETIGLLFGEIKSNFMYIHRAIHYGAHRRTRTQASYNVQYLRKRREELSKELGLEFIGLYHSHVEIAGKRSLKLSKKDKSTFLEDEKAIIELLTVVSAGNLKYPKRLKLSVVGFEKETKFYYVIRTYHKIGKKIKLIFPHVIF